MMYSTTTLNLLNLLNDVGFIRIKRDSYRYEKILSDFEHMGCLVLKGVDEFVVIRGRFPNTFLV